MEDVEKENIVENNKVKTYFIEDVGTNENVLEDPNSKENTLKRIYEKIKDRSINPIENSYTNYLLEKGIRKICKK